MRHAYRDILFGVALGQNADGGCVSPAQLSINRDSRAYGVGVIFHDLLWVVLDAKRYRNLMASGDRLVAKNNGGRICA